MDVKTSKLSQLGHFLYYCPFKGGHSSFVNREIGVYLREVTYVELKERNCRDRSSVFAYERYLFMGGVR